MFISLGWLAVHVGMMLTCSWRRYTMNDTSIINTMTPLPPLYCTDSVCSRCLSESKYWSCSWAYLRLWLASSWREFLRSAHMKVIHLWPSLLTMDAAVMGSASQLWWSSSVVLSSFLLHFLFLFLYLMNINSNATFLLSISRIFDGHHRTPASYGCWRGGYTQVQLQNWWKASRNSLVQGE